jgi:hypothetical protein
MDSQGTVINKTSSISPNVLVQDYSQDHPVNMRSDFIKFFILLFLLILGFITLIIGGVLVLREKFPNLENIERIISSQGSFMRDMAMKNCDTCDGESCRYYKMGNEYFTNETLCYSQKDVEILQVDVEAYLFLRTGLDSMWEEYESLGCLSEPPKATCPRATRVELSNSLRAIAAEESRLSNKINQIISKGKQNVK